MTAATTPLAPSPPPLRARFDWPPMALVVAAAAIGLAATGNGSTWMTLTVAGLATGMIIFLVASGLTLVFGLMDVLNFGHGVFITLGAYIAMSAMGLLGGWAAGPLPLAAAALLVAALAATVIAAAAGAVFERLLVRPVYGRPLEQILVTMGGLIIGEELIRMIWGPDQLALPMPPALRGSFTFLDASVEKYRLIASAVGIAVFAALQWALKRTKIGLLVRAGVQDREMVESLGYRIRRLFVGVFIAGSALAGLGGALWAWYQQAVAPQLGGQLNVLALIVIIIGGPWSALGCFIGALLVGLVANYAGFLAPKFALFSTIALMVAVLMWRPRGLYDGA